MKSRMICLPLAAALLILPMISSADDRDEVGAVLDAFHSAAARADLESYLELLTPEVVFLGTDGSERWQGEAFRRFASDHFSAGRGWIYTPRQRQVQIGPDGSVAWFDEMLDNDQLGELRGSGVLLRRDGTWKVAQYNLSMPIPNGLVLSVGQAIRDDAGELPAANQEAPAASTGESSAEAIGKRCPRRHKTNRAASC